jgi:hypothetical protein
MSTVSQTGSTGTGTTGRGHGARLVALVLVLGALLLAVVLAGAAAGPAGSMDVVAPAQSASTAGVRLATHAR